MKTTSAGHAKNLASSVDISTCPDGTGAKLFSDYIMTVRLYKLLSLSKICGSAHHDANKFSGIICVGGDGIINEVSKYI